MHVHPFHRARVERGLTIEQLAQACRLPPSSVKKIDEGRFEELPAGIYARSHIRAVASALGLDPAEALAEVEALLPAVADPLAAIRESLRPKKGASGPSWTRPRWEPLWDLLRTAGSAAPNTMTPMRKQALCAALDALILCAINISALALAAALCGQPPHLLVARAPAAVSLLFLLTSLQYFLLMAGIAGRTLGERACAISARSAGAPLSGRDILARAATAWWDESSVLLNVLFASQRTVLSFRFSVFGFRF